MSIFLNLERAYTSTWELPRNSQVRLKKWIPWQRKCLAVKEERLLSDSDVASAYYFFSGNTGLTWRVPCTICSNSEISVVTKEPVGSAVVTEWEKTVQSVFQHIDMVESLAKDFDPEIILEYSMENFFHLLSKVNSRYPGYWADSFADVQAIMEKELANKEIHSEIARDTLKKLSLKRCTAENTDAKNDTVSEKSNGNLSKKSVKDSVCSV